MPNRLHLAVYGALGICLIASDLGAQSVPAPAVVWQPVHDYAIRQEPGKAKVLIEGTQRFNSFVSYTNLGTDFGFHGPAEHDLVWQSNEITGNLTQEPDAWAGVWHSLAGLAKERQRTLNFSKAYPAWIAAADQPRITHLQLIASGEGRLLIEIKDGADHSRWSQTLDLPGESAAEPGVATTPSPTPQSFVFTLPTNDLTSAKFLNWTLEPGSNVTIHSLALGVQEPAWSPARRVFVASYAKASRNYGELAGFLRDRGHLEEGAFNTVSGSALFALATAAAASPDMAVVSKEFALTVLRRLHRSATGLIGPMGLLPHFVSEQSGAMKLHPGTELSTVDSAIYFHAMLLAAHMLGDATIESELLTQICAIDFESLRLPDGSISHGLLDQGKTLITHGWRDWGGETALVLLLNRIANPGGAVRKMDRPGEVWQGAGFIAELQSLLHPDFDSRRADALQGVTWGDARRRLLSGQQAYFSRHQPDSFAARIRAYGLSAGESAFGNRYQVGGSDLPDQSMIHPHYILMTARLASKDPALPEVVDALKNEGLFPPWGLVECFTSDGQHRLPMNGGLNSTFEALGAYHWLALADSKKDVIYEASKHQPNLRRAMMLFFSESVASTQ